MFNQITRGNAVVGALTVKGSLKQLQSVTNIADGTSMVHTTAGILGGITTATLTTARTITTPTAADLIAELGAVVGTSVQFSYINLAAYVATLAGGTGVTIVGLATTAATAGLASRWEVVVTAPTTVSVYRIA
jgi:hypothetical protein